jgi:threonine/homoserine/homoserine lactone efflux protein
MGDASTVGPVMTGLGLGLALASAPGPVQAVLLAEAFHGGLAPGLRAIGGATTVFGLLLISTALGISVAVPSGPMLRFLEIAGAVVVLWLAIDALRSRSNVGARVAGGRGVSPAARGALAVALNPGAWLFLPIAAGPLFVLATRNGTSAIVVALALLVGVVVGDTSVVLVGSLGLRRIRNGTRVWVRRGLACLLAGFAIWMLVTAIIS